MKLSMKSTFVFDIEVKKENFCLQDKFQYSVSNDKILQNNCLWFFHNNLIMIVKKQSQKQTTLSPKYNLLAQQTNKELPKIYGTIKNKVRQSKIHFYQNIGKQRTNLIKSFNQKDLIQQFGHQNKGQFKPEKIIRKFSKKNNLTDHGNKQGKFKLARFQDKYNKFQLNNRQRRYHTFGDEDTQSKHKIKINTIKFLPILIKNDMNDTQSILASEKTSKSLSVSNPLIHLYRKKKSNPTENETVGNIVSPSSMSNENLTSINGRTETKSRVKTDFALTTDKNKSLKRPILQTEFSKKVNYSKMDSVLLRDQQDKFQIPQPEQYMNYIQTYQPLNPTFNLKDIVKDQKFKIISYKDGLYFGVSEQGQRTGQGVLITEHSIFEGTFKNNEKIKGFQQNMDGKYIGTFKLNQRDGKGRYEWNNGQIFQGQWKSGRKSGYGVWHSPNGDSYVGDWLNGRQHGTGTHTHKNSTYKGSFINSLKDGFGEQIFANGDKFRGNYKLGKPSGKGRYDWVDGSWYEGQFAEGYRDGQGTINDVDGTIYRGSFKRDFKHGEGQQIEQGQRYWIEYEQGLPKLKRLLE